MLKLNKVYCGNCIDVIKQIDDESIHLTVTSPPYDRLRKYEGYSFDYKKVLEELLRVTVNGGVVVWVVGDAVESGSETGTSFVHALCAKEVGFNLHDTMIYEKNSSSFPASPESNRYTQIFEYMFVLSKGVPATAYLIKDKINKWAGVTSFDKKIPEVPDFSPRTNIWKYTTSFNKDGGDHPAVFPEKLAEDHILTWSKKGDTILDPMCGSGTTLKMAYSNERNYIGIDISEKYCEIARNRLERSGKMNHPIRW